MSSKLTRCVLLLLSLLLIDGQALAQHGLEVTALVSQPEYLLGEPVNVYISVKNLNRPDALLPKKVEPEYGLVGLEIRRNGYPVRHYRGWSHKCLNDAYWVSSPNNIAYGTTNLLADAQGPVFPSVGSYRVRATYQGACSAEITVKIVNSLKDPNAGPLLMIEGEAQQEARKYLNFGGGDHLTNGLALLNAWANSREPSFAAHFNLARGTAYLDNFANFTLGRLRAADPSRAVSYLEQVRANPADLYTHVKAHLLLEEGYAKLGNHQSANAVRSNLNALAAGDYAEFSPWINHMKNERAAYLTARTSK